MVFKSTIVDLNVFIFSKKIQILSRRRSNSIEQSLFIYNISAKSFYLLTRQQKVQTFIIFMKAIDQQSRFNIETQIKLISFNNIKIVVTNLQNIKKTGF